MLLKPGAIVAAASSYRVTGSTEDGVPCMSAGQDVEIALAARDAYGNAVADMAPGGLRAVATDAAGAVRFQAVEVREGTPSRSFFRPPCFNDWEERAPQS